MIRRSYKVPAAIALLLLTLVGVAIWSTVYYSSRQADDIIADDVVKLATIFAKINASAKIESFDQQQNTINFLTVKSFTSGGVGGMNISYPDKWEGPYLKDDLTIQGKEYMVVQTKIGFFITPANGVRLGNNKVIGIDIILDENADIEAMLEEKGDLVSFLGRPLAAHCVITPEPELMVDHIARLAEIFKSIDQSCKIMSFDSVSNTTNNPINFLTVQQVSGSEVGPLNLAYPTEWKGPYLQKELSAQGKEYQIIKVKQGHFIVPGNGVRLPNGKIIGKTLKFTSKSDVTSMMRDPRLLQYQGKPLAVPLAVGMSYFEQVLQQNILHPETDTF